MSLESIRKGFEGAVVMSRAAQDIEPFETVAKQLVEQARASGR